MNTEPDWIALANKLKPLFEDEKQKPAAGEVCTVLQEASPATVALTLEEFEADDAAYIFNCLDDADKTEILSKLETSLSTRLLDELTEEEIVEIVESLPPREAATLITEAPKDVIKTFLLSEKANPSAVHDAQHRLQFEDGTAGRLMTTRYLRIYKGTLVRDAIKVVKHTNPKEDIPANLFVVERGIDRGGLRTKLLGVISIRDLLMEDENKRVEEVMETEVITIPADTKELDAAALLGKYKFMSLPVTDHNNYLVGVIPADDLMQTLTGRLKGLYNRAVGTDAEKMEKLSPWGAAKLRVPWLLGTMALELVAGVVISHYDAVLQKVILLASFMPVISAISGNVGLQAAAITVRAVDTGLNSTKTLWHAIRKEGVTSLIMAVMCGLVLGAIGSIWAKHLPFGLVIGGALTVSMLTAGFMGTVIPIFSKKLGFDPATTAGPFETAFQDIIGFGVFLWLATTLQDYLV